MNIWKIYFSHLFGHHHKETDMCYLVNFLFLTPGTASETKQSHKGTQKLVY